MTSCVRPWCAEWREIAWDSKKLTDKFSTNPAGMVRLLYMAWELDDEELFALSLEDLALRTKKDTDGLLSYKKRVTLNDIDHLGPQDVLGGFVLKVLFLRLAGISCYITYLDAICAIREALLGRLITPVHEDLDARMKAEPYCKVGNSGYPKMLCDAATIGSLHRHMLQARGNILPRSASEIEDSVVELGDWLFAMMAKVPSMHCSNPSDSCNLEA